jgi:hypothetical protein
MNNSTQSQFAIRQVGLHKLKGFLYHNKLDKGMGYTDDSELDSQSEHPSGYHNHQQIETPKEVKKSKVTKEDIKKKKKGKAKLALLDIDEMVEQTPKPSVSQPSSIPQPFSLQSQPQMAPSPYQSPHLQPQQSPYFQPPQFGGIPNLYSQQQSPYFQPPQFGGIPNLYSQQQSPYFQPRQYGDIPNPYSQPQSPYQAPYNQYAPQGIHPSQPQYQAYGNASYPPIQQPQELLPPPVIPSTPVKPSTVLETMKSASKEPQILNQKIKQVRPPRALDSYLKINNQFPGVRVTLHNDAFRRDHN